MIRPFALSFALLATAVPAGLAAQGSSVAAPASTMGEPTYADLVALADGTPLVIKAVVKRQIRVEDERAPGLKPDFARLYIEAETLALLSGTVPVGQSLRYLVDVPLTAKGKVPRLKKQEVILFARPVPLRPGELQLTGPRSQLAYSPALEARLRPILAELVAPSAPPAITGIAEAMAVTGTLAGESETQVFLETAAGTPVSITVVRRPGQEPRWGVSWREIVDQSAAAPAPQTLAWYRLACGLPQALPEAALVADEGGARELARRDYAFVLEQLGPCERGGST